MASNSIRALHYVYKFGDRNATASFYKDILGMKVLRHEEFSTGCGASCNGPYDGKWSKTMVGYGSEDDHFVCELTYNYGISTYKQGNSFVGLFIRDKSVIDRATAAGLAMTDDGDCKVLEAPGGYKFHVSPQQATPNKDPVYKVSLSSSNLEATTKYWQGLLGFIKVPDCPPKVAQFSCGGGQAVLEFRDIGGTVEHAKAGGRVAFSCPSENLRGIEAKVRAAGHTILTPYLSLDTPGKATVQVVILADPDGHEICFVGDEGFRLLAKVDPAAEGLLKEAMSGDRSDDWFSTRGGKGAES